MALLWTWQQKQRRLRQRMTQILCWGAVRQWLSTCASCLGRSALHMGQ